MEHFTKQDEANKATSERLNVIYAALTPHAATNLQLPMVNKRQGGFFVLLWHEKLVKKPRGKSPTCRVGSKPSIPRYTTQRARTRASCHEDPLQRKLIMWRFTKLINSGSDPSYWEDSDSSNHVTAFSIAMRRAHFTHEEKDAEYCQLFVERLSRELGSHDSPKTHSFCELSTQFLKQYTMFIRKWISVTDLWKMSQSPKDREYRKIQSYSFRGTRFKRYCRWSNSQRTLG